MTWDHAILNREYLNNDLWIWLTALCVAVLVPLALRVVQFVLVRRLLPLLEETGRIHLSMIREALIRTTWAFRIALGMWVGSRALVLPDSPGRALESVVMILVFFQLGLWGQRAAQVWIDDRQSRNAQPDQAADRSAYGVLGVLLRVLVWAMVLLLTLDNLGLDVTALVTGLGIGGIAIALAVQNILSDVFCSVSILLDKPFAVGDFIVVGAQRGNVEHIGIKTTRVRSLDGEQIIFSNADLVSSRIANYRRMEERRVLFQVGVTYQTSSDNLVRIPSLLRQAVEAIEGTRFDRAHFTKFGDSALIFETVYYVLSPEYARFMDIQQVLNMAIHRSFEEHGIDFAYPTQTLYLHKEEQVPA